MQDKLKPYPQYKESVTTWFGKIPEGWIILRNKYFLSELNIPSINGNEELLTVSQYTGITKRKDRLLNDTALLTTAKTLEGYKIVEKEAMVMNIMLAWNGSLGVSEFNGIVSPAYCVFRINKNLVFPKYLHYLHRTKQYTGVFETASTGVIKSRLRLYPEKYLALTSALPPPEEQYQIARFLDWKTSQITKFIKAKKRMIELLKEQKQVIINDAVTGKIDVHTGKPYPKYKDSGVEWLGMVPEEWEVRKVKNISMNIIGGATPSSSNESYWNGDIIWITPSDISKNFQLNDSSRRITLKGLKSCSTQLVPKGSIIITCRAPVGNVGIADVELCTNQGCKSIIVMDSLIVNSYLAEILKLNQQNFNSLSDGTTFKELSIQKLKDFKIPVPTIKLQQEIMEWIKNMEIEFNSIIAKTENEISLLNEYRTRLIADVVTGKVDVRDIVVPENADDANDAIDASVEEEFVEETDEQSVNE